MNVKYILHSSAVIDEENNRYSVYGITAINKKEKILKTISDIFFDKDKAKDFINLCNNEKIELIHIEDIVEDQLN